MSALICLAMLAGVPLEANKPNQGLITKPGNPDSAMVGMSLKAAERLEPVTLKPLTVPARMC